MMVLSKIYLIMDKCNDSVTRVVLECLRVDQVCLSDLAATSEILLLGM